MNGKRWAVRGRPRGARHSRSDNRILEYIAMLSIKHGINSTEFFNAIVHAWKNQKAKCRKLIIEFRIRKKDYAVFLITKDNIVVAQFPVPECILTDGSSLREFERISEGVRHAYEMKKRKVFNSGKTQIRDLKAGMKRINLKAQIIEIAEPKQVLTRLNEYAIFAKATLFDKTGTIKLTLWNGRIKTVSLNDIVQIENASVVMFRGEKQLKIRKNTTLEVVKPANAIQQNIT